MANLIRVTGAEGALIYSGDFFSTEEAKADYEDETGFEAEKVDELSFDTCKASQLRAFALSGNE